MRHLLLIFPRGSQPGLLTSPEQDRHELVSLAVTEHKHFDKLAWLAGNKILNILNIGL